MARPSLRQRLVGRLGIEVVKRDPPRAGQHRALHDAVVNERIMHDDVVAAEQMADNGDVRRMAADQRDRVLSAVNARQCPFQIAVDRALAGHWAARRDRGAIAVDRRLCSVGDARIAVEPDIIVGREIEVGAVADQRLGAGDALMHAEERIADPEILRGLLDQANFPICLQLRNVEPPCGATVRSRIGRTCSGRGPPRRRDGGQLLQQARLRVRRQPEQISAGGHRSIRQRPSSDRPFPVFRWSRKPGPPRRRPLLRSAPPV